MAVNGVNLSDGCRMWGTFVLRKGGEFSRVSLFCWNKGNARMNDGREAIRVLCVIKFIRQFEYFATSGTDTSN